MKLKFLLFIAFCCNVIVASAQFVPIDSMPGANGLFGTYGFLDSKDSTLFYVAKKAEGTLAIKAVTNGKNPRILIDSIDINKYIRDFTLVGNNVFFTISDNSGSTVLYKSNGTKSGSSKIYQSEGIRNLKAFKNNLVFSEKINFDEYHSLYNSSNGKIEQLNKFNFWGVLDMVVQDSTIYIIGDKNSNEIALLSSKGKKNDLVQIKTLNNTSVNSHTFMSVSGANIYFFFESKTLGGRYLWVSNGTSSGTKELLAAKEESFFNTPVNITYNGKYYTRARNKNQDDVIYVSDGTPGGTMEMPYKPNNKYDIPLSFTIYKNNLYFTANNASWNRRLWVIKGNAPAEEVFSSDNRFVKNFIDVYKDSLLFIGVRNALGTDFLLSGGSGNYSNLTNLNKDVAYSFDLANFKVVANRLFVIGALGKTGNELWEYDANVKSPLVTSITQAAQIKCNGDKAADLKANATGGTSPYSYLWSNAATTETISQQGAGVYNVTITDKDNKTSISSITLTEPAKLAITTTSKAANPQFKNGNAVAAVTGGTSPYIYLWNTMPAQTSSTATGLLPGSYSVTATDANACKITATVSVATSTSNNEVWEKYRFELFPNPTSDYLTLKFEGIDISNARLSIIDLSGKIVLEQAFNSNNLQLNVAQLPVGTYSLHCQLNQQESATSTLVIQR